MSEEHVYQSNKSLTRVQSTSRASRPAFKRLIVCCDGTWLDSNGGLQNGKLVPPSNVTRIARAIRNTSSDGIPQIVYYGAGIGSTGTFGNKVVGGSFGAGLAGLVREAFSFVANNYADGDEIFLIGFSRGAFTARSVGGLISDLGVLTKAGMASFAIIYKDYANRYKRRYKSPLPNTPFPDKPSFRDPMYVRQLETRGLTTLNVRIRAIGVFDTVGSLGVPRVGWLGRFGQRSPEGLNEYAFYDTALTDAVDNAFQALALDEKRAPFQPAVFERKSSNHRTKLVQVWFPGVHANIGGGYDDQELSNITLAWMMAMLGPLLDIDMDYITTEKDQNDDYYEEHDEPIRGWSFGKIYNSVTGVFSVSGTTTRTPGNYHRTDPRNGDPTDKLLRNTNEYIHSSVRTRYVLKGEGYGDRGVYSPPALRNWRLRSEEVPGLPTPWFWEEQNGDQILLPEAPLRRVEKVLLGLSPDVEDYVLEKPPPPRRRSRRT